MSEIVLMSDPKITATPVQECGEPLVDVRRERALLVDARLQDAANAFAHLREGVVDRLMEAQGLLSDGLRLLFVEGYRPLSLQRTYFEGYSTKLQSLHPEWSAGQVRAAASRFVSPPEIAPHSAGAAVDLTLADIDGRELDMGTQMNASPEASAGACYTGADNISAEARENRKIFGAALTAVGLVNYPTEWWHWSLGDRYWAQATGADHAFYGPRELS
ncbi:M15 family metallopeptidase [Streptomyces sp. NPDC055134]